MNQEYAEYLLKKTKDDYNLIAEDFSRYRARPWLEGKFLVSDYVIPGERVLDLGCGVGQWFEFFKEKEADYFGVDFSEKLIEIAKKKHPQAKFQVANAQNLPFPNNYFDKVYAIALFHHFPSRELRIKVLEEIRRVLREKGFLIFTVWNLWQKWQTRKLIYKFILLKILGKSKLDFQDIQMTWQGMKDCYFHCFTKRELEKWVKGAGFKIIKSGIILVGGERKLCSRLPNSNFYFVVQK